MLWSVSFLYLEGFYADNVLDKVVPVFSALSVASAVARCKIPYLLPPLRRLVEYGYRHRWHITWLNWISARRA